jgi:hypothetical protein
VDLCKVQALQQQQEAATLPDGNERLNILNGQHMWWQCIVSVHAAEHYNTGVDTLQPCSQPTPSLPLESTNDNGTCLRKHEGVQDLPVQAGREQRVPGVQQREQRLGFPRLQAHSTPCGCTPVVTVFKYSVQCAARLQTQG